MDLPDFVWPPAWTVGAFMALMAVIVLLWLDFARRGRRLGPDGLRPAVLLVVLALVIGFNLLIAALWPWERAAAIPVGMAVMVLAALLPMAWLGTSRRTAAIARAVPLWLLVGAQAFRLPLEVLLHRWADAGTIPRAMTWTGQNLDVLSGLVAGIAGLVLWRFPGARWAGWIAQVVGLVLLANVLRVVVASVPLPLWEHWAEPPLMLVAHPPLSLIGPLAVGSALARHLLALRALRAPSPPRP